MRAAIECRYEGRTITVEDALSIRDGSTRSNQIALEFLCIECGDPIKPHTAGENSAAHFEHYLSRNYSCSYSAGPKLANAGAQVEIFDIDDKRATEGYEIDKQITSYGRNRGLVASCKERDKHTCQACGLHLIVHGRYVIECHHTKPVAMHGEREVLLDELICLCPTCHRIAHTRLEPLSVLEIKAARGGL